MKTNHFGSTRKCGYRSDELIGSSIINTQDEGLGSVEDIVMSPETGKIAYLVIGHGGLFGRDEKYIPVPWQDFKSAVGTNRLILSVAKTAFESAPQVTMDHGDQPADFANRSQKVDTYWVSRVPTAKN
jgi:sporulation protein YlmC with PRC-barrel domain